MMSDWQTDLAVLTECYDSAQGLSNELGYERDRVRTCLEAPAEAGEGFQAAVTEHRRKLKKQNQVALDLAIRCIQTLEWVMENDPDADEIEDKKQRIQEMTAELCD